MSDVSIWWLLVSAAVAVELMIGMGYPLMLAVGMVAGAFVALSGAGVAVQLVLFGLVSLLAVGGLRFRKLQALKKNALQDWERSRRERLALINELSFAKGGAQSTSQGVEKELRGQTGRGSRGRL